MTHAVTALAKPARAVPAEQAPRAPAARVLAAEAPSEDAARKVVPVRQRQRRRTRSSE